MRLSGSARPEPQLEETLPHLTSTAATLAVRGRSRSERITTLAPRATAADCSACRWKWRISIFRGTDSRGANERHINPRISSTRSEIW